MKPARAWPFFLAACLVLAGCVTPQIYVTSIGPLRVDYDPDVTIFETVTLPSGEEVTSFPQQGGLVVRTLNGRLVPFEAREAALEALEVHCRDQVDPSVPRLFGWRGVADDGMWSAAGCE